MEQWHEEPGKFRPLRLCHSLCSATTKNLFCHKAGGSSFSGCQCYFPTYWLGLFRGTAVNW
ncbi:hypothetical protein COQ42_21345 [Salmonella enterica]|nr:hypothetical protein [Salmonella enterica]